jgi:hypothetical protein
MKFSKKHLLALAGFASVFTNSTITLAAGRATAAAPTPVINVQPRPGPYCTRIRCYQTYTACMAANEGACTPQGPRSPLFGIVGWSWGTNHFDTLIDCLNSNANAECVGDSGTLVIPPEYSMDNSNQRRRSRSDATSGSTEIRLPVCVNGRIVTKGFCGSKPGTNAYFML